MLEDAGGLSPDSRSSAGTIGPNAVASSSTEAVSGTAATGSGYSPAVIAVERSRSASSASILRWSAVFVSAEPFVSPAPCSFAVYASISDLMARTVDCRSDSHRSPGDSSVRGDAETAVGQRTPARISAGSARRIVQPVSGAPRPSCPEP